MKGNTTGKLFKKQLGAAKYDSYGQPIVSTDYQEFRCSVVTFNMAKMLAQSGSSEREVASTILVEPQYSVDLDDKVEVRGAFLRIESVNPSYDTQGKLDHYNVKCSVW